MLINSLGRLVVNPKPGGVALGYINIAPLGLTLKSLLALSVCIIKASVTTWSSLHRYLSRGVDETSG